jgi:hypothetical protein
MSAQTRINAYFRQATAYRVIDYERCSNTIACDLILLISSESWPAVMTKLGEIGNPPAAKASATQVLQVFHRANCRFAG